MNRFHTWRTLKRWVKITLILSSLVLALFFLSIVISFLSPLSLFDSLRIFLGSFYVLFLPGFILSYLFFPNTVSFDSVDGTSSGIDFLERTALSFALSIAIVPLAVFYLNLVGLRISTLNSILTILAIILISLTLLFLKSKRKFNF